MRRILVGTDGSEGAMEAVKLAADLAKATGVELILAHVAHVPAAMALGAETLPEFADDYLDATKRQAFEPAIAILDEAGATHEDVVLVGSPAPALLEEAERRDVDCIVVGHSGHSTVERLLMGSVSDRIAHRAKCAVLRAPLPTDT